MATELELKQALIKQRLKQIEDRQGPSRLLSPDEERALIPQLGGRLPFVGTDAEKIKKFQRPYGGSQHPEVKRQQGYDQLINAGVTRDEIIDSLAYEKAMKPPSKTPQAIGSTLLGLAAAQLIPGPLDDLVVGANALKKMGIGQRVLRGTGRAAIEGIGGVAGAATQMVADPDIDFNLKQLGAVGLEEGAYGLGGEALGAAGRKMIAPFRSSVIEGGQEISDRLVRKAKEMGIKGQVRLNPAQMTESKMVDTLVGIGENPLIDLGIMGRYHARQVQTATEILSEAGNVIAGSTADMTPMQLRNLLIDVVDNREVVRGAYGKKMYEAVDAAIGPGAKVDLSNMAVASKKMLERAEKALNIGETSTSQSLMKKGAGLVEEQRVDDMLGSFFSGETPKHVVDWDTAKDIRSRLLKVQRAASAPLKPDLQTQEVVGNLVTAVDNAMERTAKDAGPEAYTRWRNANTFYKAEKGRFHNDVIQKLRHKLPEDPDVVNMIFNNEENLIRVKKAVGPRDFQAVKRAYWDNVVAESMVTQKADITKKTGLGEPLGEKILKNFNKTGRKGHQSILDAAFTKREQETLRDSARTLGIIQAKTGGHEGALRFVQGAAVVGLGTGLYYRDESLGKGGAGTSGAILIGPSVMALLLSRRPFVKMLAEGYKAPRGTLQAIEFQSRLIRNVLQARQEVAKRKSDATKKAERPASKGITAPSYKELGGFGGRGY